MTQSDEGVILIKFRMTSRGKMTLERRQPLTLTKTFQALDSSIALPALATLFVVRP